ncbi:MAG TPA: FUSC family protein [Candidatus Dormibacteraeota bacterium]|nr:FUSC family protein [Candidatus Dormibacteraeota bacterium]
MHRSLRAAVVNPATFAVTLLVIGNVQLSTFAVFGCFALLVMADFGGPRRARAVAYLAATLAGAAAVTLGTAASSSAAAATLLMLAIGFALSFADVFGGYLTAARPALLLAFVLAVSIPAGVAAIPARVAGWLLAGAVSTLAGVFFWPWFERETLRRRAADACLAAADLVEAMLSDAPGDELTRRRDAARDALREVRSEFTRTAHRPAGPTRADRAFVELLTQLERIVELSERPFHQRRPPLRPSIDERQRLVAAVVGALRGSAVVLTGGPPPDIRAVDQAWRAHRTALDRWAVDQLRKGRAPEDVLEAIDLDHTLRVIAYVTLALSANAVITAGGRPDDSVPLPAAVPRLEGTQGVALRIARTIRAHLEPDSTVLHNSLRTGAGLAAAVLLARTLGLSHAFWVVLGTLSVLRSNALGTGRSTLQALAGTLIGFAAGGVFAVLAGDHTVVMWLAMPVAIFLASYAAGAVGFVAGQAAFTLAVIVIFNLLSPAGWQVGLVRIEDVAVGTGISVVAGLLLWPRGARRDLARATAGLYRAVAAYLESAFGLVLADGAAAGVARARAEALRARGRAAEGFDAFLAERGAKPLDPETAGRLISAGNQALLAGDLLVVVAADLGYRATSCPDAARAVEAQVRALLGTVEHLAEELDGRRSGAAQRTERSAVPPSTSVRSAVVECMRRAVHDESAARGAMAALIAGEWVDNLARLAAEIEDAVRAAGEAAATPWWR